MCFTTTKSPCNYSTTLNSVHVVLSMYNGQLNLIRKKVADAMEGGGAHVHTITQQSMCDVRMSTTDNNQGEESDLVSLDRIIPPSPCPTFEGNSDLLEASNRSIKECIFIKIVTVTTSHSSSRKFMIFYYRQMLSRLELNCRCTSALMSS